MARNLNLGQPEKFSFAHLFVRVFIFCPWFKLWYKNVTVVGKENLDHKTPTILAINHQNTAMDPLALVGAIPRQITWLARADLYNIKAVIPILHAFKVLPVFRQRDGLKNLENNDAVFNKIVDVLAAKKFVGIFPEGTHWGFRRLRQTRKAIPRIVELAEKRFDYNLDINVTPVGIYYDDYKKIRTNLFVKIGKPIPMRQYLAKLKENPQVTENEIKDAIEVGMRNCMLDIPQMDELYDTVDGMRAICRETTIEKYKITGKRQECQYLADKKTIEIIEDEEHKTNNFISSMKEKVAKYQSLLAKNNYSQELITKQGYDAFTLIWNALLIIVGFPLFACSCVLWILDYLGMRQIAKLAKDPLFKNSIMFVGGRLILMVTNLIWIILWLALTPFPWWTVFIFWTAIFFLWPIFIDYPRLVKRTIQGLSFNFKILSKNKVLEEINTLHNEIISDYVKILK